MKNWKYIFFILLFGLPNILSIAYAQQESAGSGINLFGSTRPDQEKLIPNCSYRNEYNPYTKQYTKNEICAPRLVPANSGNKPKTNPNQVRPQVKKTSDGMMYYIYAVPATGAGQQKQNIGTSYEESYLESFELYMSELIEKISFGEQDQMESNEAEDYQQQVTGQNYEINVNESVDYTNENVSSGTDNESSGLTSWDEYEANSQYLDEDISWSEESSEQIDSLYGYSNENVFGAADEVDTEYVNEEAGYSNESID